ncbi:MAG: hypothetical protein LBB77_07930, partial [Treponema sp.]|nr:hypothetical protein [Treponema sp.]
MRNFWGGSLPPRFKASGFSASPLYRGSTSVPPHGIALLFLALALAACSAGGAKEAAPAAGYARDAASYGAQWKGAGFNSENPAALEGQTPPVFKDMGGLYGE